MPVVWLAVLDRGGDAVTRVQERVEQHNRYPKPGPRIRRYRRKSRVDLGLLW